MSLYVAEEDDDDDAELELSSLGKRTTRSSISSSSKDVFDIDANRSGGRLRSGAKYQLDALAKATEEVVKKFTASKKTTAHDEIHQAVTSNANKFMVLQKNEETGQYDKARCVTQDSQSYEIVNAVFSDGKAVQFDSQQF